MPQLLPGKVVAVTGAASGIGRATCMLAAKHGASAIVMLDLDAASLEKAADEIAAQGCGVRPLAASVTDADTPDLIVRTAVETFGQLDAAVNAAGIVGDPVTLTDCGDDLFDRVMEVNLRSTFRLMRAQLRQMMAQSAGSIVNLSSASAHGVHPLIGPYIASKAAIGTMSKVAAKEVGPWGVRVNAVCPGLTDTPLTRSSYSGRPGEMEELTGKIPLRRMGRPDEIAEAIVWLCSDSSSFTSGTVLIVDGGRVG